MSRRLLWVLLAVLPLGGLLHAQGGEASVSYPASVSLLRGTVEIRGTMTLPDATTYFVQVRELDETLEPVNGPDALWSPATLPGRGPVTDGVLGSWNTTLIDDGIYELELVVERTGAERERVQVRPVRVANDLPEDAPGAVFSVDVTPTAGGRAAVTPTATATTTFASGATATPARDVIVTATIQANVRLGDSTSYPAVGFLDVGDSADALGVSSRSRWLQVRLSDGEVGFISPSVVNVEGDTNFLPRVDPPPLPVTPTPLPTATPAAQPNLAFDRFETAPSQPVCNETFTITATVRNNGNAASGAGVVVSVEDRHVNSGTVTETTVGAAPSLAPGETFNVIIPITVTTFFEETHRLTLVVDSGGAVSESNEGDNGLSFDYTLAQGTCG